MREDGITRIPATPGGARVQRAVPTPHQRPRITVGGGAEPAARRRWTLVPAHRLKAGDIVPDIGRLFRVDEVALAPAAGSGRSAQQIADAVTWTVTVHGGLHHSRTYPGGEPVYAFTVEAG